MKIISNSTHTISNLRPEVAFFPLEELELYVNDIGQNFDSFINYSYPECVKTTKESVWVALATKDTWIAGIVEEFEQDFCL